MKLNIKLVAIFLITNVIALAKADTVYKWTDESGVKHYSNKESSTPTNSSKEIEEFKFSHNKSDSDSTTIESFPENINELSQRDEVTKSEEEIREYWEGLARLIKKEEEKTLYEINLTKEKITYLKKEVDYYLINGYSADYMIYELRYLESRFEPLYDKLESLKEEKLLLKKEARKQGIPPGYLRP